ncbi:MAG: hypothetical protein JJE45_00150 [Prolixibacteraceae bacterium]|nr:hypothetical protein [Prolixibacteraceae bacterium]
MNREDELKAEIKSLEVQIEPKKAELLKIRGNKQDECEKKIKRTELCKDKFAESELRFAAYVRCSCGAGMAYPENIGMHGSWYCSDILLGLADPKSKVKHTAPLPFVFYEIKSDTQPSAEGATTRKRMQP